MINYFLLKFFPYIARIISLIKGNRKAHKKDQKSIELIKIWLKKTLSKIIPINKDFEKSAFGKNNNPEKSPIIIKNKVLKECICFWYRPLNIT